MKSIMQEGSSVAKAIEQAWQAAGKPREFSVKVYEEAVKNFFGMTKKSAKVAIFFNEEPKSDGRRDRQQRRPVQQQLARKEDHSSRESQQYSHQRGEQRQKPTNIHAPREFVKEEVAPAEGHDQAAIWTDEMVQKASEWLRETLGVMNLDAIPFATTVEDYQLRFTFQQPLRNDQEQERNLFRSFSFLMLQSLKRTFKRPLRGFKIVLTR